MAREVLRISSNNTDTNGLDCTRMTLAGLMVLSPVLGCSRGLGPFLADIFRAVMPVVATWLLLPGLENWVLVRRRSAVTVMMMALFLVTVLLVLLAVVEIVGRSDTIASCPGQEIGEAVQESGVTGYWQVISWA
jgi:predicted PurR-regulated permease PerM